MCACVCGNIPTTSKLAVVDKSSVSTTKQLYTPQSSNPTELTDRTLVYVMFSSPGASATGPMVSDCPEGSILPSLVQTMVGWKLASNLHVKVASSIASTCSDWGPSLRRTGERGGGENKQVSE